ncbi:MAG: tRNA threonylcarbamoyladenosine dehydratase [Rhodocyclaceae bacterium]
MSSSSEHIDYGRRFGGVVRLYGQEAADRFAAARVCVVGIGGVGSWAAEALARSAVGHMTLIDLDMIAESNTNRQIHALGDAYGMAKVDAMRDRILAINPRCEVTTVEDFVAPDNLESLLAGHDIVLDAIDNVGVKVAMAAWSRSRGVPLVMCGGAGGKADPTRLTVADLSTTEQDPLLAKVRSRLRKEHGFPKPGKGRAARFDIEAIYSSEPLQQPDACSADSAPQGLSCAGYGSAVTVTAVAGFMAASRVLARLATHASSEHEHVPA